MVTILAETVFTVVTFAEMTCKCIYIYIKFLKSANKNIYKF